MQLFRHLVVMIGIMLLSAILFSCNQKRSVISKPPPPPGISHIKIFLDNSESNMGYLSGATQFKSIVDGLITDVEDEPAKGINYFYISDSVYPQQCDTKKFIAILSDKKIKPVTLCSEMHHMMDMLTSQLDSNDIGILVSDCILSYCDLDGNPEKNRDDAPSQLKTSVKTVFKKLSNAGICASLYGFKSAFTGRYFKYNNTWENYAGESRPFYIWFIGRREQLNKLNNALAKNNSFQTTAQLHFGFNQAPLQQYNLFFTTGKKGSCRINSTGLTEIALSPAKPVNFVMGVNLDSLPAYAQNVEYIKNNISISFPHLRLTDVKLKNDFELAGNNTREKSMKENNTHFLFFEMDDFIKDIPVEVSISNKPDNWYENWSTMNDMTRQENKEKTFALVHLIDGVKEAFNVNNTPFFKATLLLSK